MDICLRLFSKATFSRPNGRCSSTVRVATIAFRALANSDLVAMQLGRPSQWLVKSLSKLLGVPQGQSFRNASSAAGFFAENLEALLAILTATPHHLMQLLQPERFSATIPLHFMES